MSCSKCIDSAEKSTVHLTWIPCMIFFLLLLLEIPLAYWPSTSVFSYIWIWVSLWHGSLSYLELVHFLECVNVSNQNWEIISHHALEHFFFFLFIELYIFLHSSSFLSSPFLPSSVTLTLPIYSGDLVFLTFLRNIFLVSMCNALHICWCFQLCTTLF